MEQLTNRASTAASDHRQRRQKGPISGPAEKERPLSVQRVSPSLPAPCVTLQKDNTGDALVCQLPLKSDWADFDCHYTSEVVKQRELSAEDLIAADTPPATKILCRYRPTHVGVQKAH